VRRLTEGSAKLAAEVRGREVCGAGECDYVERLAVKGVDKVLRAEEMPDRMDGGHWPPADEHLSISPGGLQMSVSGARLAR